MIVETAVRNALADVDGVILVTPEGTVEDVVTRLRRPMGAHFVLLLLDPAVAPLDRAMLIAAMGPLATECAPALRIAAIDVAAGAAPSDVATAAVFLAGACSTTGQVLRIEPEPEELG